MHSLYLSLLQVERFADIFAEDDDLDADCFDEDDDEESQEQTALNKLRRIKAKQLANQVEMNLCMNILLQRYMHGSITTLAPSSIPIVSLFLSDLSRWNAFLRTTAAASKMNQKDSNFEIQWALKSTRYFVKSARLLAKEKESYRYLNREGCSKRLTWRYNI